MSFVILCRVPAGVDAATQFAPYLADERAHLVELKSQGFLTSVYTVTGGGAVIHLEAPSIDEARHAAETLPLHVAGLLDVEVLELTHLEI